MAYNITKLNEYQELATRTAEYPNQKENIIYPTLGLVGEAGEFADKVKKYWRNHGVSNPNDYTPEQKIELIKELGDVMWYIASAANELGVTLGTVASMNIDKLMDRKLRGTIKSEGDNR